VWCHDSGGDDDVTRDPVLANSGNAPSTSASATPWMLNPDDPFDIPGVETEVKEETDSAGLVEITSAPIRSSTSAPTRAATSDEHKVRPQSHQQTSSNQPSLEVGVFINHFNVLLKIQLLTSLTVLLNKYARVFAHALSFQGYIPAHLSETQSRPGAKTR